MNEKNFLQLSNELQLLVQKIPLSWGKVQNNKTDYLIDMFSIKNYDELEQKIELLTDSQQNYFRRRWFLWKCAQCDEYLFNLNENVQANPNPKSQDYDFEIHQNKAFRFDLKGTRIPKKYSHRLDEVKENPQLLINFFYANQSKGQRSHYQNRIFLVHHSYKNFKRELYLRCCWKKKRNYFNDFVQHVKHQKTFLNYKGVKASIILFTEQKNGDLNCEFY